MAVARYIRLIGRDKINVRGVGGISIRGGRLPSRRIQSIIERKRWQLPDHRNLLRKGGIISRSNLKGTMKLARGLSEVVGRGAILVLANPFQFHWQTP